MKFITENASWLGASSFLGVVLCLDILIFVLDREGNAQSNIGRCGLPARDRDIFLSMSTLSWENAILGIHLYTLPCKLKIIIVNLQTGPVSLLKSRRQPVCFSSEKEIFLFVSNFPELAPLNRETWCTGHFGIYLY